MSVVDVFIDELAAAAAAAVCVCVRVCLIALVGGCHWVGGWLWRQQTRLAAGAMAMMMIMGLYLLNTCTSACTVRDVHV